MSRSDGIDHSLRQTTLISAIYPVGPASIILMPLIVGGLVDSYGFSEQQAGVIATGEGIGLVLGLLSAALWVRSVTWRLALLVGLTTYAALNFGSPLVDGHAGILVLRFLSVLSGVAFSPSLLPLWEIIENPIALFGIAQAVQGLVMGALFAWAPSLMSESGINSLFYLMAILATTMIFVPQFPRRGVVDAAPVPADSAGDPPSSAPILLYLGLFGGFAYYLAVFGFWGFIERMGIRAGLEESTIGYALGISLSLRQFVGPYWRPVQRSSSGRFLPLLIALVVSYGCFGCWLGSFPPGRFMRGLALIRAFTSWPPRISLASLHTSIQKGKFIVVMTALQGLGAALGPSIAAALIDDGAYSGINVAAALTLTASLGLFLVLARAGNGHRHQ